MVNRMAAQRDSVARRTGVGVFAFPQPLLPIELLAHSKAPHGVLGHRPTGLQLGQPRTTPAQRGQGRVQQFCEGKPIGEHVLPADAGELQVHGITLTAVPYYSERLSLRQGESHPNAGPLVPFPICIGDRVFPDVAVRATHRDVALH
ncbi:hypothetical protein G6F46_014534 [Rhizopus delemar]|nr:hypothetical protein G6F46_014534 [Rhizopus delemar]